MAAVRRANSSRAGGGVRPVFEGGQLPLVKRLPKMRGFNNRFKVYYVPVNLDELDRKFEENADVTTVSLCDVGLLGRESDPIVVLGRGEVSKVLHLKVHRISAGAKAKIEAAGGRWNCCHPRSTRTCRVRKFNSR